MREVDAVHARFTGDTSNLDAALRRADDRVRTFGENIRAAGRKMLDLGAAAGVAAGGMAAVTSRVLSAADAIGKSASVAGVTTTQIQELRFAFGQLAGTTERDVDLALQRFNRRLGLARQGAKEYADTFGLLNVQMSQDTPAALEDALQALSQIENGADRAAAASKIFGEEAGPRLAAALAGGIENVAELRKQINEGGGVIGEQAIRRAEEFNDKMDLLSKTVTADFANTILENADAFEVLATSLGGVAGAAADALAGLVNIGRSLGSGIFNAQEFVRRGLAGLGVGEVAARDLDPIGVRQPQGGALPSPGINPAATVASGGGGSDEFQVPGREFAGRRRAFDAIEFAAEEQEKYLEQLAAHQKREQEMQEQHKARLEEIERQHTAQLLGLNQRTLQRMEQFRALSWDKQASTVAGALSDMTAATSTESKAMFQINKAAALANAALSAKEAVTGAYAVGARIGGPPLGAAFAATAAAAQAAQLGAIASTSFGSGTAPSVGATPAPAVTPVGGGATSGQGGGASQPSQTLTVRGLDPNAIFSGDSVRVLADQLLEFQRDGGRVVLQG